MSINILNVAIQTALTGVNQALHTHDLKNCRQKAYLATGKKINKARKRGRYINGKAEFRRQFKSEQQKADNRKELRSTFFNAWL